LHAVEAVNPTPVLVLKRAAGGVVADGPSTFSAGTRLDGNGVYARWQWDGTRLTAATDVFGVQPLFYTVEPDAFRISPSIATLLGSGAPPDIDGAALAVFLRIGFFVGDDTPFSRIRAMPAGGALEWSDGTLRVDSRRPAPSVAAVARDEVIDRFAALFTEAVARRLDPTRGAVVLPLTGGHDSRHILLTLRSLDHLPASCLTVEPYPPSQGRDVQLARELAARTGVAHIVLPQRRDRVAAESEKNTLTSFCADEHVQFLPIRSYLERHPATVFDGIGGDVLSQSRWLDPSLHRLLADGRSREAATYILGDAAVVEPAVEALLTRDGRRRFPRDLATARVADVAAQYADDPNPIASFFMSTRMRREIALSPCAILDVAPTVWMPFLDPAVARFLLSVPFEVVRDRRLHADVLARHYPEYADVPLDGNQPGRDDPSRVKRDALALIHRVSRARTALVARGPTLARVARALASGRSAHLWFLPKVIHLLDVEAASRV
jgi:hypothetical protein